MVEMPDATPVARRSQSVSVPATQNTAPVLEFRCLYTHDLRRKQKRWQDGRLKFHTFNKRIMVYDERGNFVGDAHWREDFEFGEGEEIELDRNGILVQVEDCVARRDQDLTELLDKRAKEKEERNNSRAAGSSPLRTPGSAARTSKPSQVPPGNFGSKSLNELFGTPTGHHGRAAVPTTSPFEERLRAQQTFDQKDSMERPAKRAKRESLPSKLGYAQNLTGATLTLSGRSTRPAPPRLSSIRPHMAIKHSQIETIDLTNDPELPQESRQAPINRQYPQTSALEPDWKKTSNRSKPSRPERSTYASNLTGAPLSLLSSSSANSNRPSTIRSNKQNNINTVLASAAEDDRSQEDFVDIKDHGSSVNPTPLQASVLESDQEVFSKKRKPGRSDHGTYASNLTGASVPLLSPSSTKSQRRGPVNHSKECSTDAVLASSANHHQLQDLVDVKEYDKPFEKKAQPRSTALAPKKACISTSQAGDKNSSISISNPQNMLGNESLLEIDIQDGALPENKSIPLDSASYHLVSQASLPEQTESFSSHTEGVGSSNTLRIKSRPRRKKLLLLDRQADRPVASNKSSSQLNPGEGSSVKTVQSDEPPLSQLSMQTRNFREAEETRLQSRLNKIRRSGDGDIALSAAGQGLEHSASVTGPVAEVSMVLGQAAMTQYQSASLLSTRLEPRGRSSYAAEAKTAAGQERITEKVTFGRLPHPQNWPSNKMPGVESRKLTYHGVTANRDVDLDPEGVGDEKHHWPPLMPSDHVKGNPYYEIKESNHSSIPGCDDRHRLAKGKAFSKAPFVPRISSALESISRLAAESGQNSTVKDVLYPVLPIMASRREIVAPKITAHDSPPLEVATLAQAMPPPTPHQDLQSRSLQQIPHSSESKELAQNVQYDASGPWSRESFDLFDWRPSNRTVAARP
jgi:hypothetical protein